MPPPSPAKTARFFVEDVRIPTSKPPRKIKNLDESKWEEGYDSDGELGPFLDAIANQTTAGVEEEDEGFLPASMVGGGAEGAPEKTDGDGTAVDETTTVRRQRRRRRE